MNNSMEHNMPSPASAPCNMQFQVSLLRLMYPDSKVSAHVAELEQMLAPADASVARS
jgi:hypothetical protein